MDKLQQSSNGLNIGWKEIMRSGQEYFYANLNKSGAANVSLKDFQILRTVGTGGFGRVVLAKSILDNEHYAIKMLEKDLILKKNQVAHVLNEKRILQAMKFPFIVNLLCFFKDNRCLYFVMPFLAGGEVYSLLTREGRLTEGKARFYAAQVVLSLEFLHSLGIAYRDLKPENLLLDRRGYLRLTDLGFCKRLGQDGRTYTVCGTPEYLAPEVIACLGYGLRADLWSLGVLLWEMCAGCQPFSELDRRQLFAAISRGQPDPCPADFSLQLRDLLAALLQTDPEKRPDPAAVRLHSWFAETRWVGILKMTEPAPFVPQLTSPHDTRYFDLYPEPPLAAQPSEDLIQEYFAEF